MIVKKFEKFIKESLGITIDTILSSINANELNISDILKEISDTDLDKLDKDNKFIELLKRSKLKKSNLESTSDYETFSLIPFKFMFLYDIKSTELDTPYYILIQVYNEGLNKYEDTRCYKINSNINNFYNQLSSKIICIQDGNENFIYDTSNTNEWTLTSNNANDIYKKIIRKQELDSILKTRNAKVKIVQTNEGFDF
jgi:hypothetical protein